MRNMKLSVLIVSVGVLVAPAVLADIHTGDSHDDHDHDHDHDHGEHGEFYPVHNETTADGMPVCATDPGLAECASYDYPDKLALEGAKLNCQMMEFMVACDIIEACEDGTLSADNPHCDNFDMLASTCKDEGMSGMAGCKVYTPMCLNESTVVKICEAHPGVPSMVNSMPTVAGIVEACAGSDLPGCADCSSQDTCPDTLESLNLLCSGSNGTIPVCSSRGEMCAATDGNLDPFCEGISVPGATDEVSTSAAFAPVAAAAAAAAAAAIAALL